MNGSQLFGWSRSPCRYITSVWNEGAIEGNVSFYPMLTHSGVDDGTRRGKDTLHCVDVKSFSKRQSWKCAAADEEKKVIGAFPIAFATYSALRLVVLLKVVPFFLLIER